jgi:hypothetical protein
LFGGTGDTALDDTWVWDGADWAKKTPRKSPPPRQDHAMAYDASHRHVILFGGKGADAFDDTWQWDGAGWTGKTPASSPPARSLHGMAYDAAHSQIVLFGGSGSSGPLGDTWVWTE